MPYSPRTAAAFGHGLRHFTNREKEQGSLRRLLELPAGQPLPLVLFHGRDGTGKSWLLRKLHADLPPGLPSALLDFEPQPGGGLYPGDHARTLAELRRQFAQTECPRFDLAYGCLRFQQGIKDDPLLQGHGLAEATSKTLAELASDGTAEALVARVAAHMGQAFQGSRLEHWLSQEATRHDISRLCLMAPEEIYPQLLHRLTDDLAAGLPEQPGRACRGVIFLDTVEALQAGPCGVQADQRGHWLLELHHAASPVLLILAGRSRLPWELWGSHDRSLELHPLGGFLEQAARAYLGHAGVSDPALQEQALRFSIDNEAGIAGGMRFYHPFSLGLCADTLLTISNLDSSTLGMASGQMVPLVDQFLKSLGSSDSETWLRRLALTPRFDETAARAAFPPGSDLQADGGWQSLWNFCFIQETEQGWWSFHPGMRQTLAKANQDRAAEDHDFWHDHWKQRSVSEADAYAALAWHHHYHRSPERAQSEWKGRVQACRQTGRMADHYWLLSWWDSIDWTGGDANSTGGASALGELAVAYCQATLGLRSENLLRAIACFEAALRIFTEAQYPSPWAEIQNNLGRAYESLPLGNRSENLHKAVACHEAALRVHTETNHPAPWAATQAMLGAAYAELAAGGHEENLRRAIACYEAALRVLTEAEHPVPWAAAQNDLGAAYADLESGDRQENLRRAIACYEAALRIYGEAGELDQWAAIQSNLGVTYRKLPLGDRQKNLRKAIACYEAALGVHTEFEHPAHWAAAQNNLGAAYMELSAEERGENLHKAIACYEAALRVHTEADHPAHWALTQHNLGAAYTELSLAESGEHLQKAIVCYEAALRVRTEADSPVPWAATQNHLGVAYMELPSGDQEENVSRAIDCFEAALRVRTGAEHAIEWAETQNHLGTAYAALELGDREENLRRVIACFEGALRVYSEAEHPDEWAEAQNSLGAAYIALLSGDQEENLHKAITCFEAALRVYAREGDLSRWASLQNDLGVLYMHLPSGNQGENLQRAIACFEAALRVYAEAGELDQWAAIQNNLGITYRKLPVGDREKNLHKAIACYEAALGVHSEADDPAHWAAAQNNLGNAYEQLPLQAEGANLRKAIAYYEAALRVFTEADDPNDWVMTQSNLGKALEELALLSNDVSLGRRTIACFEAAQRGYAKSGFAEEAEVMGSRAEEARKKFLSERKSLK